MAFFFFFYNICQKSIFFKLNFVEDGWSVIWTLYFLCLTSQRNIYTTSSNHGLISFILNYHCLVSFNYTWGDISLQICIWKCQTNLPGGFKISDKPHNIKRNFLQFKNSLYYTQLLTPVIKVTFIHIYGINNEIEQSLTF